VFQRELQRQECCAQQGGMREIGMVIRERAEFDHVHFMPQAEWGCQVDQEGCSEGGKKDRGQFGSIPANVTVCGLARVIVDD
jgi:hypothetical protein